MQREYKYIIQTRNEKFKKYLNMCASDIQQNATRV